MYTCLLSCIKLLFFHAIRLDPLHSAYNVYAGRLCRGKFTACRKTTTKVLEIFGELLGLVLSEYFQRPRTYTLRQSNDSILVNWFLCKTRSEKYDFLSCHLLHFDFILWNLRCSSRCPLLGPSVRETLFRTYLLRISHVFCRILSRNWYYGCHGSTW